MTEINGLLDLVLKLFPLVALGIYLGKKESLVEALEKRVESLEKTNTSKS